jgi:spermidine/putrescine transport system substrate-binding protein
MKTILMLAGVILSAFSSWAQSTNILLLCIRNDSLDPAILAEFERKNDCKVAADLYPDTVTLDTRLKTAGAPPYDVVVPREQSVAALVKLKLLAPLRHDKLPNLKHLEERFRNLSYDPSNRYTVAMQWGTVGLFARKAKDKPIEPTWGLLFDPAKQPGPFVLMDSPRELFGAALKYKGYSLNTADPAQLREARDLAGESKSRSLGLESGLNGQAKVAAKTAALAMACSGSAVRAMKEDPETVFFVPQEGGQIWIDNLGVHAKAPHRDLAEKFINFLLEPETAAKMVKFSRCAIPNKAAQALMDPEDLKNPVICPTAEMMEKLEIPKELGRSTRLYEELWSQMKSQ